MIAIIDYDVGNLFSLKSSLDSQKIDSVVTGDKAVIKQCEKIILPGVGAFADAAEKLRAAVEGIRELLARHPEDVEQSSVLVTFDAFGDYSLNLEVYYYAIRTTWADYMRLKEAVNFEIRELLDGMGVEIAFPTQVVLTKSEK